MNIKDVILGMPLRADKWEEEFLVQTFVGVGPLIPLLQGNNNHVLFGRRGTGKTHVLMYLKSILENDDDCCVYIDIRKIGSTGSIYSDKTIPIEQRTIRLFTDILQEIRNQIVNYIVKSDDNKEKYLSNVTPLLDGLCKFLNNRTVTGSVKIEKQKQHNTSDDSEINITISEGPSFTHSSSTNNSQMEYEGVIEEGAFMDYMDFSSVFHTIQEILSLISPHKLWLLFDEFSELDTELQIILSDMFRRVFCPLKNCIFKIAAIEHRSDFKKQIDNKNYIGLELGADVSACNLDDFMVFGNNHAQSLMFFRELLYQHINSMLPEEDKLTDSNDMVKQLFTQETAFEELVQAAEGVPRDAFNILVKAITVDYANKVSVSNIRKAAKNWYIEDKQNPIRSYEGAMALLTWIIDNVINKRHARAFLLRNDVKYDIVNFLYDSRILHIIKQNISSRDKPGMKFNAYSIDYGCYVDLINTTRWPLGLFEEETEDGHFEYVKVPKEDYRSIRRAVLNMDEFYSTFGANRAHG